MPSERKRIKIRPQGENAEDVKEILKCERGVGQRTLKTIEPQLSEKSSRHLMKISSTRIFRLACMNHERDDSRGDMNKVRN